jgi:hypothetical protein
MLFPNRTEYHFTSRHVNDYIIDGNASVSDVWIHLGSISIFNKGQWGKKMESGLSKSGSVN